MFALNGKETEILWGDKCGEVQPNYETIEKYVDRTKDDTFVDEAEFCAGGTAKGETPCDVSVGLLRI